MGMGVKGNLGGTSMKIKEWIRSKLGRLVGILALFGLRYGVKHYIAEVDSKLVRGSRISDAKTYLELDRMGVDTIVDLCVEGNLDKNAPKCFNIHRIPVIDNSPPFMSQVEEFIRTVVSSNRTFVHCEAGIGRTGTFVACYRISVHGWTAEQALEEAAKYGNMVQSQKDFIYNWDSIYNGYDWSSAHSNTWRHI